MIKEVIVTNLITQDGEILSAIQEVSGSGDEEKILKLLLKSTNGTIPIALKIAEAIHRTNVDLVIECSGEISPAGLLIAAAGKPKNRIAHYSTIFKLKDNIDEGKKGKAKDPYTSCMIETLGSLGARKNEFAEILRTQSFITAIDAKRLKIIDDPGLVQNKYKKARKNEEASEKEIVAQVKK